MNYDNVHLSSIIKNQKLYVNKRVIFITFPDTNLQIWNEIYHTNLLMSNCAGIVCPNKIFSIGNKKFNGKAHYLEVKKRLLTLDEKKIGKKIKVLGNLIEEKDETEDKNKKPIKFFFYDASMWTEALAYLLDRTTERVALKILLKEFQTMYEKIKSYDPTYDVDFLFLIKNQNGNLFNLFQNIRTLIKTDDFKDMKFFDNFTMMSDCQEVLMPIIRREKDETKLILMNINKMEKFVEIQSATEEASETSPISDEETEEVEKPATERKTESVISNIVKDLQKTKVIATSDLDDESVKMELNHNELRKILKTYKIDDPDIIANVKTALDAYIATSDKKPTREEAESVVIKAINYTVYGHDQVKEEHLDNPARLINKLKQIDTYRVPLDIYDPPDISMEPSKIIDLKFTTGQHRQKFEFENAIHENVKKLFGSLENIGSEHPVKLKKLDWTVEDDNKDRFINYKATLQNVNGGKKEPYIVQLKVPSPVSDKYFKLHGNHYIMSTQQFLRPVTKTDKNEVRMISNYAIVRIGLANIKFNPSDIEEICEYIRIRYPKIIEEKTDQYCKFTDSTAIFFAGDTIYVSPSKTITIDDDTGKLINKATNETLDVGRYEFLFQVALDEIARANPEDTLSKTKRAVPYIFIYIGAIKMPIILYMWSQKGLLAALNDYGIDYELVDEINNEFVCIPTKDNKFLLIKPDTLKERLFVNGLVNIKFKSPILDLTDPQAIFAYIAETYGSRAINLLTLLTENFVDPVTKELLQFEDLPTNLVSLSSTTAVDRLLNQKIDSLSDLKLYRSRLSEVILNQVFRQLKMAHNYYRNKVESGDETASVYLDPEYVITNLLTEAGVLQNTEPVAPVSEIMQSSRVIKSGKGGVPSRRSFKKEHRNIHPSQYGIMGANSTPEYVDVGLVTHHTMTPVITNQYGSYGFKDIAGLSGWQTVALDESLTPFQNQIDSDRMVLARTHANQATPVSNSEAPLVGTGAEFIVPQLASSRFVQKAKKDGSVTEVDHNKTMTVKYKDGTSETFDIIPRLSRTKRGAYISLEMTALPVGSKFKTNQIIAYTKNFDKNGTYCAGANVFIAIMNYMGYNHEDSYVVSKTLADNTKTDVVIEKEMIIEPNTKILRLEKEKGRITENGDILVEFSYDNSLEDYLDATEVSDDDDEILDLFAAGEKSIKMKSPGGEIVDIKLYINSKNLVDKSLLAFHNKLVDETKALIIKLQQSIKDPKMKNQALDNLDMSFVDIGGHKYKGNPFNGAKIVYYIKQQKSLQEGDKIANRFGSKGVISMLLDPAPKGEITPKIDVFLSPLGIFSRKNLVLLKELYIGKLMYFGQIKLKEMSADTKVTNDKLVKFINDLYSILGPKKIADNVKTMLNQYTGTKLRTDIKNDNFKLIYLVEPFEDVSFETIKSAAEFLHIPLEEKVYIPELDQWTDTAVPVGVSHFLFLEHYVDVYANVRGTGKFVGLTRQPTRRASQGGGQSIARLDMYSFLTHDAKSILSELLGPRSDEHRAKRTLYNDIVETGELSSIEEISRTGGTKNIFNLYMTGLGLEITN